MRGICARVREGGAEEEDEGGLTPRAARHRLPGSPSIQWSLRICNTKQRQLQPLANGTPRVRLLQVEHVAADEFEGCTGLGLEEAEGNVSIKSKGKQACNVRIKSKANKRARRVVQALPCTVIASAENHRRRRRQRRAAAVRRQSRRAGGWSKMADVAVAEALSATAWLR